MNRAFGVTPHGLPISVAFRGLTADQAIAAVLGDIGPFDTEFEPLPPEFVSPSGQYIVTIFDEGPPNLVGMAPAEDPEALVALELLEDTSIRELLARDGVVAESQLVQFVVPGDTLIQAIHTWLIRVLPVADRKSESLSVFMQMEDVSEDPPILGVTKYAPQEE
jgi:hypothetical protein